MIRSGLKKFFAISMISFILFWTAGPSIILASFISPGTPITPGSAIKGGSPITGGQFIAPGEVIAPGAGYAPGQAVKGGNSAVSGQPIISGQPSSGNFFITPNFVPMPYNGWLQTGSPITGGQGPNGGQGPSGGDANSGGTGSNGSSTGGGQGVTGGTGPNGGQMGTGGTGPGGTMPGGGQDGTGGTGPDGTMPGGGQGGSGGTGPGGTMPGGGQGGSGGTETGGTMPEGGQDGSGGTSGSEPGIGDNVKSGFEFAKNAKKALITVPGDLGKVLDGSLSIYAGFKITDLKNGHAKSNRWLIEGNSRAVDGNGKMSNWLNKRYSNYLNSFENSKAVVKSKSNKVVTLNPDGTKKVTYDPTYKPRSNTDFKQTRLQGFIDENISAKTIAKKTGSYFKKNWIPIDKGKFNPAFFNLSPKGPNLAKANGIANVVLSVGYRLAENAADPSRTGLDLAAGISTDVVIGAGTTALSAGAGWLAAAGTAAAVGSVVPGVGTVIGAAVGIGAAIFMSTPTGKSISKGIEKGIKNTMEAAGNLGKKVFAKFGWGT